MVSEDFSYNRASDKHLEYTVHPDGGMSWRKGGLLHRENGPALIWISGYMEWRLDGELHRDDGPAIKNLDGSEKWYQHGKLHRENAPAVIKLDARDQVIYEVWYRKWSESSRRWPGS